MNKYYIRTQTSQTLLQVKREIAKKYYDLSLGLLEERFNDFYVV